MNNEKSGSRHLRLSLRPFSMTPARLQRVRDVEERRVPEAHG